MTDPNGVVLALAGELDLTTAQELGERLDSLGSSDSSPIFLDLSRVTFIDSAALHVLFRAARQLGSKRFGLVVEPEAAIARTLDIVGISAVATVAESVEDLTLSLSSPGSVRPPD